MVPIEERARRYIAKLPPGVSGSNRHSATFHAAFILTHGFALPDDVAWSILAEFNARCDPPSDERKLRHRFMRAKSAADTDARKRGWAIGGGEFKPSKDYRGRGAFRIPESPRKLTYDCTLLERFAGEWAGRVDLLWLAARSVEDPCVIDSGRFLSILYKPNEKVLVFTNSQSQGDFVWPGDKLPAGGPQGVLFLAQPVTGDYMPNPRQGTMSRRSEENVTSWRYLVIESDKAPAKLWLGALVQMPLKVSAIYSSGKRSVHACVRIDARTKSEWDKERDAMKQALVQLGADPGAMTAVRLTRLPGCYRGLGKAARLQKLLYINPAPPMRPLIELRPRRDVLKPWLDWAQAGIADSDETGGAALTHALNYYASVSPECIEALKKLPQ